MFPRIPMMFAIIQKFDEWENSVIVTLKSIRTAISYFFLGDISTGISPQLKSFADPNGVGIIRVGPPLIGTHCVYVDPKTFTPEEMKAHAEYLYDLPGKEARLPLDICSMTNSSFFLAMNNKEAIQLRNKSIHFLKPSVFLSQLPKLMTDLYNELPNYQGNKTNLVERHIINLFTRSLFGFELNNRLFDAIKSIVQSRREFILLPRWLWRFVFSFRKLRSDFDLAVKDFLREQFRNMKNQNPKKLNNMFCHIALAKLSRGKKLTELTDYEIEKLIVDPEVRLCITGIIGIENLTKILDAGLSQLYSYDCKDILKQIGKEVSSQLEEENDINKIVWTNKETLPLLHAYFLETLRYFAPLPILRYSSEAFSIARLSIPARSIIIYDLPGGIRKSFGSDSYLFRPHRFLDELGRLNELANLQQGIFIPFGDGIRSCPTLKVSEIIFKRCVGEFSVRVKNFGSSIIEFHTPPESKAQSSIVGCSASLFAPPERSSKQSDAGSKHARIEMFNDRTQQRQFI